MSLWQRFLMVQSTSQSAPNASEPAALTHSPSSQQGHSEVPAPTTKSNVEPPRQAAFVPSSLYALASWGWRFLIVVTALYVILWITLKFSVIVISILLALLLAVVLHPLSNALHTKLHFPYPLAAGSTVLALLAFVGALLVGAGTGLYQGFSALSGKITAGAGQIVQWLIQKFPLIQDKIDHAWNSIQDFLSTNGGQIAGGLLTFSSSMSTALTAAILVIFSLFFFLADGRGLWQWFVRLLPERYRTSANEAGIRAWVTLGGYVRNQSIAALFDALAFSVVATCLGTPFSLVFPIGAIVFLCAYVPIIGLIAGMIIASLVVLVSTGSFLMAFTMLIGAILVQQFEGNVLSPTLQGKTLNLHAWAILLLVMGGSMIAGIFGALFTVPLAAAINTAVLYLRGHDTYPYLNSMPNRPGGPQRDFSYYADEYWRHFDNEVAQQLPPREARKAKRAAKRAAKARAMKAES
ncbi:MAG: AI-2E family transporter [Arcanobacterium sp.]|nr:AI-2E family transporter [Arcanobacterium sp.]